MSNFFLHPLVFFFNYFFEKFVQYSLIIFTQLKPDPSPLRSTPNNVVSSIYLFIFIFLFFLVFWDRFKSSCAAHRLLHVWSSLEGVGPIKSRTLKESNLHSPTAINCLLNWGKISRSSPLFLMELVYISLVPVVSTAVSSYLWLPCCIQKILFPCGHSLSLTLRILLYPPSQ